MEEKMGSGRGSYIYGMSVHNIRIERLWVDWTRGVGKKWYNFFFELEGSYGLIVDNTAHLWLLHHLFLAELNQDALEWADSWNCHKVSMDGARRQSPHEMFTFGLLEYGAQGISHLVGQDIIPDEDLAMYGIDWEAQQNADLTTHHLTHNPTDALESNPFATFSMPSHMSEIIVEPPNCPLTPEQCVILDGELAQRVDLGSRDMVVQKLIWKEALAICNGLFEAV
ncbi:hypothetical protein GGX14DRAFT_537671 [Mycena pura]|uniref:Integrase core domain-containing protein n=1 Tax=Mycena pura TaxID=153505 RepID=A0AAD6Y600_9AGAR|nr:hypothetical protein GGX14DRAFT_537671 [Mycena pura]